MPFINGRYHVNPTMGAALEAAREAEAALLALQDQAHRDGNGADSTDSTDSNNDSANAPGASAPIHRVEIEASELVPSHQEGLPGRRLVEPGRSVRATRGFVARIHRSASQPPAPAGSGASCSYNLSSSAAATKPETHVFSNHGDLLDFLHNELSKH